MAWVHLDAYTTLATAIMTKRTEGTGTGWLLSVQGPEQVGVARRLSFAVSGGSPQITAGLEFPLGGWHHVAVVHQASAGTTRLFQDGALVGSGAQALPQATQSSLFLGRDSVAPRYYLKGKVDDVSLWSRALSQDEVLSLSACALRGTESGLISSWNFDDMSGADATGRGHAALLAGVARWMIESGGDSVHSGNCRPQFDADTARFSQTRGFRFTLDSIVGSRVQVESSEDLVTWVPVVAFPKWTGSTELIDPSATNSTKRFYRAVRQ